MDNYVVLKQIGHGAYGKAFKAVARESHDVIVIKAIDVKSLSAKQRADAVNEVNVLRQLRHPFIIRHLANFVDGGKLCIVMDFAAGGDLASRIKAMKLAGNYFSEAQISRWFSQILLGLAFMHSKNVMHRDLKPHNIFLSGEGDRALIGDFGVCRVMQSKHELAQTITGTPYYLSPEIFQHKPYSFKSDMWALGCILYELASLSVPFDAIDVAGLSVKVCRGSNPVFPPRYSLNLKEIFQALAQRDYRSRPSADELLARPHIASIVESIIGDSHSRKQETFTTATSTTRSRSPSVRVRVPESPNRLPPKSPSQPAPLPVQRVRSASSIARIRVQSPARASYSTPGRGITPPASRTGSPARLADPTPRTGITPSARLPNFRIPTEIPSRIPSPRILRYPSSQLSRERSPSPRVPSARLSTPRPLKDSSYLNSVERKSDIKGNVGSRIYPPSPQRQRVPLL